MKLLFGIKNPESTQVTGKPYQHHHRRRRRRRRRVAVVVVYSLM